MAQQILDVYLLLLIAAFILSFILLIICLNVYDSELITDKIENVFFRLTDNDQSPIFGNGFRLFEYDDLADCICCCKQNGQFRLPVQYECQDGAIMFLRQCLAWIMQLSFLVIFIAAFGFCCSVSWLIHTSYEAYPKELHSYSWNKAQTWDYLFSNLCRESIESKPGYGKEYFKHLTKSQDLLIKVCCLHCYLYQNPPIHYWTQKPVYPQAGAKQYLIKQRMSCYSGVTWDTLRENITVIEEYDGEPKSNYRLKVVSLNEAWEGLVHLWGFNEYSNGLQLFVAVFLISIWFMIELVIHVLPIIDYLEYYDYDFKLTFQNIDDCAIFLLHNGLIIWALLMRLVWIASLWYTSKRYYTYLYCTRLMFHPPHDFFQYHAGKEYIRVLESIAVAKALDEYQLLNQDVRNIIMEYHDTMMLDVKPKT